MGSNVMARPAGSGVKGWLLGGLQLTRGSTLNHTRVGTRRRRPRPFPSTKLLLLRSLQSLLVSFGPAASQPWYPPPTRRWSAPAACCQVTLHAMLRI